MRNIKDIKIYEIEKKILAISNSKQLCDVMINTLDIAITNSTIFCQMQVAAMDRLIPKCVDAISDTISPDI